MKVSVPTIQFSDANVMKLFAEQIIIVRNRKRADEEVQEKKKATKIECN